MAQNKHLHELLREDQEPFLLKDYIADRRDQIKRHFHKNQTQIQLKKRTPISDPSSSTTFSSFPHKFCKSACFFSFHDSPDHVITKSPLFSKSPNPIFHHTPSRTRARTATAVLLEAAVRVQRPKIRDRKSGFGLFGSVLKKLTHRNRCKSREIDGVRVSSVGGKEVECGVSDVGTSASYTVWSDNKEERSLDLDTSSSSIDSIGLGNFEDINDVFASSEKGFCESPFRFVLHRSPSSCRRTPEFSSQPALSCRRNEEEKNSCEENRLSEFGVKEEEEVKEQCSPVSVLDPPFNDDDDANEDSFDIECSYAIVQRTKQHLLQKLSRFEKLAELDPIELEKMMLEDDDDENDDNLDQDESCDDELLHRKSNVGDHHCSELLTIYSFQPMCRIPVNMKRLVLDLIGEESKEVYSNRDDEAVAKGVCKRLESWKEVEANTIDMMVEMDFRRELDGWKKRNQEQVGDVAMEIECAIFGLLVEELSEEVASVKKN